MRAYDPGTEDWTLSYLLTDHPSTALPLRGPFGKLRATLRRAGLGSMVAIIENGAASDTDDSGSLISEQRYLPFGQVREDVGTIAETDFGYTGQRALSDMGLMDYKARFYSATLMRFLQPDSLIPDLANPQSLNRYAYVRNNAVNFNDPTGHWPDPGCGTPDPNCNDLPPSDNGGGGGEGDDDEGDIINHRTEHDSLVGACIESPGDCYLQGWNNFGSAWSTWWNPNAIPLFKAYAGVYIIGWGGFHLALAVGLAGIACVAAGPACATTVEAALGIGTILGTDGDPTNEISAVGQILEIADQKITYLLSSPGKAEGFQQLGYEAETLRGQLEALGRTLSPENLSEITSYGYKFENAAEVIGPSNLVGRITAVWQMDYGSTVTRLITGIAQVFK
jgi:RHS repeat-associated protein